LPDFSRTLLKSSKSPAAFQKSFVMYQLIGCREFHFSVFKRVLQIQNHLVLKVPKPDIFDGVLFA
jgi:hypothetical protein